MHIAEGVLAWPVLAGGGALAAGAVGVGLRGLDEERLPQVAVLSAAFFVASLVPIPLGGTSVHLLLTGLLGVVLGWAAMPAVLVALLLQAVIFGHGAVTALGVNTLVMGLPAVACHYLFGAGIRRGSGAVAYGLGFAAGALGVALGCALLALALATKGQSFALVVRAALGLHVPILVVEGFVVAHVVLFLRKVRPEVLEVASRALPAEETSGVPA